MNNYAVRNLSSSLENLDQNLAQKKAVEIVKYQNFKTKIAMQKISYKMAKQVFDASVGYLKYGTYNEKVISKTLKKAIDEAVASHIQPLTPKDNEKRVARGDINKKNKQKKYQAKNTVPPIAKLEILKKPGAEVFDYGVRVGDNIRIFQSEGAAKSFLNGLRFFCSEKAELVEVKFNEVK